MKGEEQYSSMSQRPVSIPIQESPGGVAKHPKTCNTARSESTPVRLEYSSVRHRLAIERVLSALQGMDPLLDSATKVWTTFAVARNLGIMNSPLEDYIIRWLRAYPNSYFLEVLPEVSHQIADGLENYDLARDSFAILVGEEALEYIRHTREPRSHKRTTFGRKKEELPEPFHTRVEYASKDFSERIKKDFAYLAKGGMQWVDELPEVRRLSAYTQPVIQDTVQKLKNLLKDYVRGAIYRTICVDYDSVPGPDLHHGGGEDLLPRLDRAAVWANMPLDERILTRTCYGALKSMSVLRGASNFDVFGGGDGALFNGWQVKKGSGVDKFSRTEKRELVQGNYREVKKSQLQALINDGQTLFDQAYTANHTHHNVSDGQSLPDRTKYGVQDQKKSGGSSSTLSRDYNLYNAQRESNIKPMPKRSYVMPDRTVDGVQENTTKSKAVFSAQPINVPKAPKRTQDFPDALSPPDDQQSGTDVRTKWPFGAARDDPVAQVLKRVDNLHVSTLYPDRRTATDRAMEESAGQGRENEGIPTGIDSWRGYSDHLSYASETLQPSAPKTHLNATKSAPEKKKKMAAPQSHYDWDDYDESDGDDGAQQQNEVLKPKEIYPTSFYFDLETFGGFLHQASTWIKNFASMKLRSSDHESQREPLDLGIVNTLVCLEDNEWKYLPLFAGGNDDKSGGVYSDNLPIAEHGFTTPGPEIHDGLTPATSVETSSEFELVSAGDSASTFNASTATNRGFSDTIRRNHVHAVGSTDGSMSDSSTMVTPSVDSDDEEAFARTQIEARLRSEEAEAAAAANEASEEEEDDDDGNDTDRAEFDDEDDGDVEDDEDMVKV